ncbi:Pyridoxine biosynthesis glutamine amidotransferase, synthase subunit [Staphylococcus aureus]|nr:Pyridoxine biosynthesis glutamine amidotransferase, synthase subunit [Staphylococcus aureus]
MRQVNSEVSRLTVMNDDEIMTFAKDIGAPYEILKQIKDNGRLPVVNFAAGGVATPQDAAFNDGIRCRWCIRWIRYF